MKKHLEYFDGAFDSTVAEKVKPENKPYVAYSKTEGVVYSIIPKEGEVYTIYRAINYVDISNCTYNMVDLGLPSGLKWADRNIGAKSPEHYGSYFQWGDTNPYTYVGELTTQGLVDLLNGLLGGGVTVDNVKEVLASQGVTGNDLTEAVNDPELNRLFNWDSYFDTTDGGNTFNKYSWDNASENMGVIMVPLTSEDDAATVHMGDDWRMPNSADINELILNSTITLIDINNNEYDSAYISSIWPNAAVEPGKLKGIKFRSKTVKDSNGDFTSIFIPAAGRYGESSLNDVGTQCVLWAPRLIRGDEETLNRIAACFYGDYTGLIFASVMDRYYGLPVRGVQP